MFMADDPINVVGMLSNALVKLPPPEGDEEETFSAFCCAVNVEKKSVADVEEVAVVVVSF